MIWKPMLGFDDSLDVVGIHGIGGLIGSVLTAVTMLPALGGPGGADYALGGQLWIQVKSVAVAVAWSAVGSAIAFSIAKAVTGGPVPAEVGGEGPDPGQSGERRVGEEGVRQCGTRGGAGK